MPVYYDSEGHAFAVAADHCEFCRTPLYDTGCDARGCTGYSCRECGAGCDIEMDPDHGRCATALDEETDDEYNARVDAERAAFGLPPILGGGVD